MGGRAYPVRHYPIAIRLRDREGRAVLCSHYFLSVGTLRVLHSECVPSHSFTQHYLGGIGGLPPFSYICCCHAAAPFAFKPPMRLSLYVNVSIA